MEAGTLLATLAERGIEIQADGPDLVARPGSRLTDADRAAIRALKADLLAALKANQERIATDPAPEDTAPAEPDNGRAAWPRSVVPDSRSPLIPPEVRAKITAIEAEARRLGWPSELLWNSAFWDCPRGLAAVLDGDDEIDAVTADYITILKVRHDLLRFNRHAA